MSNIGNKETMAKNLSYYVDRSGKTQKEICEDLNFSRSTFNEWMKGRKYPRIDKIEMLADYFGILKSDLIEEKSNEEKAFQKENDTMTSIVIKMRTDEVFFDVVRQISEFDKEKIESVKQLLSAFGK